MTALTSPYRSVPDMFRKRVAESPGDEAYRYPDGSGWSSLTWEQTLDRVRALSLGLHALGVSSGQRCAILASTRLSWILADIGILCSGAATTTIYPSSTADECQYIGSDSQAQVVFAEDDAQVEKLRSRRDQLPELHHVVTFDGTSDGDSVLTLDELESRGRELHAERPELFDELVAGVQPENLATLVYTSGTTGRPKGVRLAHGNWLYVAESLVAVDETMLTGNDLQYLWLPLSHVFGKVIEVAQIRQGFPTAVDGNVDRIMQNLPVVRPTFMAAAPRIFEKAHARITTQAQEGGALRYRIFQWAKKVGTRVSRLNQQHKPIDPWTKVQHALADRLVFQKIRDRFGGRLRYFVSGSAPLSPEIAEFFNGAGIRILEGYGLTETCAASFMNLPEDYRIGTVGKPFPGTEISFLEDGEILIRNGAIMHGYHNMPEETSSAIDEHGWFHTGDIGRMDDGFLRITDRKKDLIKTSGGKYVAPQSVEGRVKAACPYVSHVIVHGDRRPYCTALVSLDEEAILAWAAENGLGDRTAEQLAREPAVRELVDTAITEVNAGLARHETLKSFALLPRELNIESGEITPSLKVKRKVVETNHGDLLDSLYSSAEQRV